MKQTGTVAPKPHGGGHPPSVKAEGQIFIKELVESKPDLILDEILDEYNNNEQFKRVSKSTIDRNLTKLKLFLQKKTLFDPRKNSPKNLQSRQNYEQNRSKFSLEDLIYIDETGCVRNLTSPYARSASML